MQQHSSTPVVDTAASPSSPSRRYLDKCSRPFVARSERHCQLLSLYLNGTDGEALASLPSAHMQFGAYVDTFPLSWNLHFFPQSLYCDDLGRSARLYSFRGTLNDTIATQVRALGGGQLPY